MLNEESKQTEEDNEHKVNRVIGDTVFFLSYLYSRHRENDMFA